MALSAVLKVNKCHEVEEAFPNVDPCLGGLNRLKEYKAVSINHNY